MFQGFDVKIHSNLPTVTLNINGAAVGSLSAADHVFRWTGVALEVGDNAVEASRATRRDR